jgi:hypothetical protein
MGFSDATRRFRICVGMYASFTGSGLCKSVVSAKPDNGHCPTVVKIHASGK